VCVADFSGIPLVEMTSGRHGRTGDAPGITLKIAPSRALVSVMARRDHGDALLAAVKRAFDIELPANPRLVRGGALSLLWCGHQHWFARSDVPADLLAKLTKEIGSLASLSDQSDSRLIVEISGPCTRSTLAKLAPIDLHPQVFDVGDTAVTLLGHIGGQVTCLDEQSTFELMVFRSFADSFMEAILAAGAEFGIEVA
jgi:methylglutamate dehydrogenase subunit D